MTTPKKPTLPPVATGYMRLTHETLLNWNAGLTLLSQRRLETRESMKKYLSLFHRLEKPVKIVEKLQQEIFAEHPVPDGWEGADLPIAVNEARQFALADFHEETIDIKAIPAHLRIADADLPKLMKGDAGDANQKAVTALVRQLGWLYEGYDQIAATTTEDDDAPIADGDDGAPATEG